MASSSEHQGLQIAVIIFALLTIIMSGATFYVFKLSEDAELRAAEANRQNADSQTALRTTVEELDKTRALMGTKFAQPNMKYEDAETQFKADMAKYANTFIPEKQFYADALEEYSVAYNKLREEQVADRKELEDLEAKVAADSANKQQMIKAAQDQATAAEDKAKDASVKLAEVTKKLNDDKQELAKQIQAAQQAMTDVQAELAKLDKKTKDEISALKNLNEGKQEQLDLLQQKTFVASDGEISWVSAHTHTVWINIGRDDGLKKNVTFSVYGLDQNGVARGEPKGSIEVTQVLGAHLAEARILEDNISDPILIRDQLYTPLWHPGRTEQFAICGLIDLDDDGVSDVGFIKDLIRRNGGEWVAELLPDGSINAPGEGMTLNTRYLIQGESFPNVSDEYSNMLKNAKQLGVETISLDKFLDYVGWKETAKVVNFGREAKPEDFLYDPNQDRARRPAASAAGANNFRRRTPPKATGASAY
jgi:hypothetical protein